MNPDKAYGDTVKDDSVEEWVARKFLRPAAYRIVLLLYDTPVHSVHVTWCFLAVGLVAAWLIDRATPAAFVFAALLIQVKSVLDAVDGQLARARRSPSRIGRFFDSAVDIIVQAFLIMACARVAVRMTGEQWYILLGIAAFLSSEIQNSFWVYYNVRFRSLKEGRDRTISDEVREETIYPYDAKMPRVLRFLKIFYHLAYGWQDRLVSIVDEVSRRGAGAVSRKDPLWYCDRTFLRASGFLGLGTHLLAMSMSLVLSRPDLYLFIAFFPGNVYMIALILYHVVSFRMRESGNDTSDEKG